MWKKPEWPAIRRIVVSEATWVQLFNIDGNISLVDIFCTMKCSSYRCYSNHAIVGGDDDGGDLVMVVVVDGDC